MLELLKNIISIPSFSREETQVADFIENWMKGHNLPVKRKNNNLWVENCEEKRKQTILLNAHIDTVKPAASYTRDPFNPLEEDGRIYGLGSNDDGGSLISLLKVYMEMANSPLFQNPNSPKLIFSATAEEEVCGKNGIECILEELGPIDLGIIGEPTNMQMAVAERGLMVFDCTAHGKSGHAARNEGINAIYEALTDIEWFRNYQFEKVSSVLGPVKMTVTGINAGTQHNVIPDTCTFMVDVRSNDCYSNIQVLEEVKKHVKCDVKERSTRLNSSGISMDHPFVKYGLEMGLTAFGSPTTSNQAVLPFTTIKIGPGQSSRSHTADEFILISEIEEAVSTFKQLLTKYCESCQN